MATFVVKSIVPLRQEKEKEERERELWGRTGSKGQFLDPAATAAEPSIPAGAEGAKLRAGQQKVPAPLLEKGPHYVILGANP